MKTTLLPPLIALLLMPCLPVALQAQERTRIDRQIHPGPVPAVQGADGDVHIILIDANSGQVLQER